MPIRRPQSVAALEQLGRARLSASFFMRDFLYSEVASMHGMANLPDHPERAIAAGTRLCEELLEPLRRTFGHVAIRSGYRAPAVNQYGNDHNHACGSNARNHGRHIWDYPDRDGLSGAMACVVIPWFADRYASGTDWRALAYWIHNHLPYNELEFYPKLAAFNIGWHERPRRAIYSYIAPRGLLLRGAPPLPQMAALYSDFPTYQSAP